MSKSGHQRLTPVGLEKMIPDEVKPGKEGDLKCGIGSCKPTALQRCANMKLFTAILALQMLFHLSLYTYYRGVIRTVERRFGFSTQDTGVMGSVGDGIQTVFVLVIGYLGRKTHKPRYLSISFMFSGIAAMFMSLPYLIYGPLQHNHVSLSNHTTQHNMARTSINYQICDGDAGNSSGGMCGSVDSDHPLESNTTAYVIFLLALVILNLSGSGLWTLGISFIDENVKKENSGMYIGFVQSMFSIGPIFGYSLAAVTTRMPEDLRDTRLSPTDPQFIGCWWLGGFIIGALMILTAIPVMFFPKHFPDYYRYHKPRSKVQRPTSRIDMNPVVYELKQFTRSLWKLVSNPTLVLLLLSKVSTMYFVVGVMMNVPRYLEIHFFQPAFVANIGTAISGALTGTVGILLGGIIMKRYKIQPRGSARIYMLALLTAVTGLCVMMFLSCSQPPIHGHRSTSHRSIEVSNECNADCGCNRDRLQSVCSPDGELYFSPCHAGCHSRINGTYSDCKCVAGDNMTHLSDDYCSAHCSMFIPYLATFMVVIFLGSVARVPSTILLFRIVDAELKSFALGIMSSLINLLGFVPGPIMFGALFDSTCLLWQSKCGSRGACLIYDIKIFRYLMHGVSLGFEILALSLAGVMYYHLLKRSTKEEEGAAEKTPEIEAQAMLALNNKPEDTTDD